MPVVDDAPLDERSAGGTTVTRIKEIALLV
jgi:hypothetical protein